MSSHLSNLYTFPVLCPYFSHLLLYMSLSYQIPRLLSYTYLYSYITCKKRTTNTQSHFHCECNKGYRETCSHHPILHLVSGNRRLMIKMMIWCDDNEVFLPSISPSSTLTKYLQKCWRRRVYESNWKKITFSPFISVRLSLSSNIFFNKLANLIFHTFILRKWVGVFSLRGF